MSKRKYFTEEERKAARRERQRKYQAKYRKNNKEKIAEYRQANKEKITEYSSAYRADHKAEIAAYRATPFGRASHLVGSYRREDRKYNRGECTVTPEWMVDNIFTQPCHYCGETDWHKLGCDRIDNNLPHTPDNVVPCCWECNNKKQKTPYDEYMRLIGK